MPVLVLIAPSSTPFTEATLERVRTELDAACKQVAGGSASAVEWLEKGEAAEITFSGLHAETAQSLADRLLEGEAVDAAIVSETGRRKKLLVSDMDSTMITIECIDELADYAGIKPQIAAITERAMNGELDFAAALTERVALLKGLPESVLAQAYRERVKFMPGAKTLVQTMRKAGAHCLLVSGGFTYFTARVAEELGFHADSANRLEIADGRLTGRVIPPILDKDSKLASLKAECEQRNLPLSASLAVGDGANDLPMIQASGTGGGMGVAYHAKPVVQAQAGIRINHCDLTALLYLQGYRKSEWVI